MLSVWIFLLLISRLIHADIHIGTAINVFSRYGYLSISMRVVPRNDSDRTWIFREPTVEVFNNISNRENLKRSITRTGTFPGDFHMEFCDNVVQLLQAYFRDFQIENLEKPWKAFTASWSKSVISRNLGIGISNVSGMPEYCYVLVRVARHRESAEIPAGHKFASDRLSIEDVVQKQIDDIGVGDSATVVDFIRSFGSHYIKSYVTGNSLYQVFVYEPARYKLIKERLRQKGISKIPSAELNEYFSPLHARYVGKIQSASGNLTVESWARKRLQISYFPSFVSLLKLHSNLKLLYELDLLLGNEALLKLELKTLAPAFHDVRKRDWFHHVLDNYLKLWEVNM